MNRHRWCETLRAITNPLRASLTSLIFLVVATASIATQGRPPGPVLAEPGISPDGRELIDVRNNNGGFVNVYAIDVLARRSFFDMTRRGDTRVPSRSMLGRRALERPTILLTNQHSLSDAEDFTEGYRSLKLGAVVGEPTARWMIYTSNVPMMDGSVPRVPSTRITASDGSDMEMHPRPADVPVTRAFGERAQGRDTQIETAVKELLARLDRRGTQER